MLVDRFQISRTNPLLIIGYEMYRKHAKVINSMQSIGLMICDEGHRLKCSAGNKTITALKGVKTQRRVLLTGTPVQNNMEEYFAMVEFVNPYAFNMDAKAFKKVFQTPIESGSEKGASDEARRIAEARLQELKNITGRFMLRYFTLLLPTDFLASHYLNFTFRRTAEVNQKFLTPRYDISMFVSFFSYLGLLYG